MIRTGIIRPHSHAFNTDPNFLDLLLIPIPRASLMYVFFSEMTFYAPTKWEAFSIALVRPYVCPSRFVFRTFFRHGCRFWADFLVYTYVMRIYRSSFNMNLKFKKLAELRPFWIFYIRLYTSYGKAEVGASVSLDTFLVTFWVVYPWMSCLTLSVIFKGWFPYAYFNWLVYHYMLSFVGLNSFNSLRLVVY